MARDTIALGVVAEWNVTELERWERDPHGELGRVLMHGVGEAVLAVAKERALKRTGSMAGAMRFEVGTDEAGVYTDVSSPVRNPVDGFPYAIMHERARPRDRRPHRSLVPALESFEGRTI